jgi:DNA (cytosine-5)-methyltransferase 1
LTDVASRIVVSLFPGVGLLDRAFEEAGYCIVRGPDLIFGGDVRRFHLPRGVAWGIIGGPPCQDFSSRRRAPPTGYGLAMLEEFRRLICEGEPEWWLCENVSRVPTIKIAGYQSQRLDVDQRWYVDVSRLRHIQFGSRSGRLLHIDRGPSSRSHTAEASIDGNAAAPRCARSRHGENAVSGRRSIQPAALASDKRSLAELVRLQGLPTDFAEKLKSFTIGGAKRAIGNGVPLPMGHALAAAVTEAYREDRREVTPNERRCACPCRRRVDGKRSYYDVSCRKRAERRTERNAPPRF